MNMRLTAAAIIIIGVIAVSFSAGVASANISTSVKKGDWIEYNVNEKGSFPGEPNIQWAKLEVTEVEGNIIQLNVTTQYTNSTYGYADVTVNFDTGHLDEGFFVPSNVTVGGVFYDSLVGNITVSNEEQMTYAGAERTVLSGSSPNSTYYWDKTKGILVEAHSFYPQYNYTIDTIVEKTNMWQAQIFGLDPTIFYTITITGLVIVVVAVCVGILIWRRKKPL